MAVAVAGDRGLRPVFVAVPHPVLPLPRSLSLPLPLTLPQSLKLNLNSHDRLWIGGRTDDRGASR